MVSVGPSCPKKSLEAGQASEKQHKQPMKADLVAELHKQAGVLPQGFQDAFLQKHQHQTHASGKFMQNSSQ